MPELHTIILLVLVEFLRAADGSDGMESDPKFRMYTISPSDVRATIEPRQPLVWSGGRQALNCSLSRNVVNVNSSQLNFYSSNQELNEKLKTVTLDKWTIWTNITDIRRNMSAENISCRLGNTTLDSVTLLVADPIQCVVMNWESMICTWEKFQFSYDANFTLIFSRSDCRPEKFHCPNLSSNATHGQCEWKKNSIDGSNSFYYTMHCITIKIQSSFGDTYKAAKNVYVRYLVKPNPVSSCRIHRTAASHIIFVNWTSPNKERNISYRVTWISKCSAAANEKNTTEPEIFLENLIPNTNYTVTIDCIPMDGIKKVGFWSDPKTLTFVTSPDVPGASPKVTPGGFKEETSSNASLRHIKLFFQPPDECHSHGEVKGYRVKYTPLDSLIPFFEKNGMTTSTSVYLLQDVDYRFFVEAETEPGYNTTLIPEPIFISSQAKKPPFPKYFVVKTDGSDSYFFSWISMSNVSSYTLYWCYSGLRDVSCIDVLQWKTVPPNQTSAEMRLVGLPEKILRFFISAEMNVSTGHMISSGMLMSNCTYFLNGESKPPHGFSVNQDLSSSSLTVEWSQPDETSCQRRAFPAAYIIVYCIVHICDKTNMTVKVNSSLESFEITGLEPNTTYSIMIKSISEDGRESDFLQRNASTVGLKSEQDFLTIIVISIVVGVICFACILYVVVTNCCSWYKRQFKVPVVVPEKFIISNARILPESSCYSNFGSSSGKKDTIVMTDSCYDDAVTPVSRGSETQTLLLKRNSMSVASSCYTNETSLQSSSSFGTSKSDNISVKSSNISGYNVVVENPCQSACVTVVDSGNSLPKSDSLSNNDAGNLVFLNSYDA